MKDMDSFKYLRRVLFTGATVAEAKLRQLNLTMASDVEEIHGHGFIWTSFREES